MILSESVLALQHMHTHGFIHGDVSAENIMLDAQGHVKIIDYGRSCEIQIDNLEQRMRTIGRCMIYLAPETLSRQSGGRHTDWWALGIVAFEVLVGRSPWRTARDRLALRQEIITERVEPPQNLSGPARHLIASLLEPNPLSRLGSADENAIKNEPFFEGVDWDEVTAQRNTPGVTIGQGPNATEEECMEALQSYREQGLAPAEGAATWSNIEFERVSHAPRINPAT